MGLLFIRLFILFVSLVGIYFLWDRIIHPILFKEEVDSRLENAVETKVLQETDKKVDEILKDEA